MCEQTNASGHPAGRSVPLDQAIGSVLAHDITEIRPGEFKGRAFRKGHVIREEDICHLQRLGKERLFVLEIAADEMHEDEAAFALASALMGDGVTIKDEPKEGKITIIAERDGLLAIDREALLRFNMMGEVMCATLHDHSVVRKGQEVAGTRSIPLVIRKAAVDAAIATAGTQGVIRVKEMRRPKAGVVITGNELYYGRVKDAFGPVITKKIEEYAGTVGGIYFAPDDQGQIEARLRELIAAGCDLLITTGGMSVDPDDVTRFAIRSLGAEDMTYGSAVLPGAMVLVAYLDTTSDTLSGKPGHTVPPAPYPMSIPIIGIPACGMYHRTTVFDLIFPRILAGERIGRRDLAELGHGGLCLHCSECRYPVCPFGKA